MGASNSAHWGWLCNDGRYSGCYGRDNRDIDWSSKIRECHAHIYQLKIEFLGCGGAFKFADVFKEKLGVGLDKDNIIAASPFSAGVMMTAAPSIRAGNNGNFQNMGEPCIARSVSVHGCSDLICQSSGTYSREVQSFNSSKPEVRDVQVDERVTVTRWSKKHKSRISGKGSERIDDWKLKAVKLVRKHGKIQRHPKAYLIVKEKKLKSRHGKTCRKQRPRQQ